MGSPRKVSSVELLCAQILCPTQENQGYCRGVPETEGGECPACSRGQADTFNVLNSQSEGETAARMSRNTLSVRIM